jgi:hypothetical protein
MNFENLLSRADAALLRPVLQKTERAVATATDLEFDQDLRRPDAVKISPAPGPPVATARAILDSHRHRCLVGVQHRLLEQLFVHLRQHRLRQHFVERDQHVPHRLLGQVHAVALEHPRDGPAAAPQPRRRDRRPLVPQPARRQEGRLNASGRSRRSRARTCFARGARRLCSQGWTSLAELRPLFFQRPLTGFSKSGCARVPARSGHFSSDPQVDQLGRTGGGLVWPNLDMSA